MKKILKTIGLLLFILSPVFISIVLLRQEASVSGDVSEKVYVALEAEGRIAVIDAEKKRLMGSILLTTEKNGQVVRYEAHNVQVAQNGSKVLVTANVNRGGMNEESKNEKSQRTDNNEDRLFIIDPYTDRVVSSVPLGMDLHLAHVVADKDGKNAYVNAQETGQVFVVDLDAQKVSEIFELGEKSGPHGLRLSPDGSKLFIALLEGQGMAMINLPKKEVIRYPLSGKVVQTAVSPDGAYAFASVFDKKEIAWIDIQSGKQGVIALPEGAEGPVQLYPSPDARFLYVADQGYYFDLPESKQVYRIRIDTKKVDQTITAGAAPHGIVVDKRGVYAYVTNLTGENLSVIDLARGKEVKKIPVGNMPNGVSVWNRVSGGTP